MESTEPTKENEAPASGAQRGAGAAGRPAAPVAAMSSERIAQLCRALLPHVEAIEREGRRCVILAKLPAEQDKPAIGFVLDAAMQLPQEAFSSSPDLQGIIQMGISEYRIGEELPVIMHVVGQPPRVEYVLFKRPKFAAAHAVAPPSPQALAAIAEAAQRAAEAAIPVAEARQNPSREAQQEMDDYIDSLLGGEPDEPVAGRTDEVPGASTSGKNGTGSAGTGK